MTKEATDMMAAALKTAKLDGSFSPVELGAKIGLNRPQSEAAARSLSDMGVLEIGFDFAAHFSPEFRKSHGGPDRKAEAKADRKATRKKSAR